MAKTDAINCVFDVGFPSFLVCSKKPGLFVLKILLPFASMQGKMLLYIEIASLELDLKVKSYYVQELRGKRSVRFWLEGRVQDSRAETFSPPVRLASKPTQGAALYR